ncbi:hypothetical protein [Paenibacillus tyrfis]|uniref:hypothetical protein n=1 Tax=Paenibacillus tyrfis TaxID=1501230 RepID=UPI0020A11C11|nr:hypothetical protein [Paenibacillus tyrfis]MCP1312080.1 hypothetical protein [Paenibacillus tyrfis]
MKEFIIMSGMIMLLMFFPVQYVLNSTNHYNMQTVNEIVHKAAQKARTDGYFTTDNINTMKADIAAKLHVDQSEISVTATTTPKYRMNAFDQREMIYYEVKVPIKRILALSRFFGVTDEANKTDYILKDAVASEVPAP